MAFHVLATTDLKLGGFIGIRGTVLSDTPVTSCPKVPVVFFYGTEDEVITPEETQSGASRISGAYDVTIIPCHGCGHDDFWDKELDLVDTFLTSV